jgi:hypothetical protein
MQGDPVSGKIKEKRWQDLPENGMERLKTESKKKLENRIRKRKQMPKRNGGNQYEHGGKKESGHRTVRKSEKG